MAQTTPALPPPLLRQVFVSSTSFDLRSYRDKVREVLGRLELYARVMEQFGAWGDGDGASVSRLMVDRSQVYLGIVAWRYGYIPAGDTTSITEQEYDEAKSEQLPCFLFLADPSTQANHDLFPSDQRDPDHAQQLNAFRERLCQHQVVEFFTTPDDLAVKVIAALHRYLLAEQWHEWLADKHSHRLLPPRAPGFVGRKPELVTLTQTLLAGQDTGLTALVSGMGGVGKSALAAEVMYRLAQDRTAFPAGISWVRCDGRTGLDGLAWVYDELLSSWNAPLAPEILARSTSLEASLAFREQHLQRLFHLFPLAANRTSTTSSTPRGVHVQLPPAAAALVLLDNVEVAFPLSRALETLATVQVTVLVTARHRPASGRLRLVPLDVLSPQSAVDLFQERYTAKDRDWLAVRDHEATLRVVAQLGALPLAIELAAARAALTHTAVTGLADELDEASRLGYLEDLSPSDKPGDKEMSVHYSLTKSLDTLPSIQRLHFAALGLLAGTDWPRELIEAFLVAVPSTPELHIHSADEDLDRLVALSLLTISTSDTLATGDELASDGGAMPPAARVQLHPLLHDLAREEWYHMSAQDPAVQEEGVLALIAAAVDFIRHNQNQFAVLAREEELLVGAIEEAALLPAGFQPCLRAIGALGDYLHLGGHWRLGQSLNEQALPIVRAIGDRAGEGVILNDLGLLARSLGHYEQADLYYEQALSIRQAIGDRAGEGVTLNNLGSLARSLGRYEQAELYFRLALPIVRTTGDRRGEGAILNNLGLLANTLGHYEKARHYYEQALPIARAIGDRAVEGVTLNNLGQLAESQGRTDEAEHYYEQALPIRRAIGDRAGEGITLNNLGLLAGSLGQYEQARHYYEQALGIQQAIGDREGEGATLNNLGQIAKSLGQYEQARHYYEQARDIFTEIGVVDSTRTVAAQLRVLPSTAKRKQWRWPWQRN